MTEAVSEERLSTETGTPFPPKRMPQPGYVSTSVAACSRADTLTSPIITLLPLRQALCVSYHVLMSPCTRQNNESPYFKHPTLKHVYTQLYITGFKITINIPH